ncbi:uncharacterized protein PSFLO_03770 [Pseudozyma flocculosa]|uniref:Secreted protein n=1 Tax=Pseudozyma flocculosa TaxID=84751 RepID=A0A5C3F1A3_9BASI|nr:uncharacterized protein PSFLO_03770 [Pseudozyma flocculosa]
MLSALLRASDAIAPKMGFVPLLMLLAAAAAPLPLPLHSVAASDASADPSVDARDGRVTSREQRRALSAAILPASASTSWYARGSTSAGTVAIS